MMTAHEIYERMIPRIVGGERAGQAAFNVVSEINPEIANEVRGTKLDPFHNDDILPLFWEWLSQRGL
jgi:hypothetical protein